uniref:RRM domain-containing protein n=1 Tax=Hordeum vulgare subsp. vulgare TaxID=112509 RepID=A0A8I6YMY4_HORVV
MGKSSKKSAAPTVVAPSAVLPKGKAGKKREADDEIEKAVSAKKQKAAPAKAVTAPKEAARKAKKQPPPKKVDSSSSEEESSESEEDEVPKKTAKPVKQESSDDSSDDSSSDEEIAKKPSAKPATLAASNGSKKGKPESSSSSSGDESDEDEKPAAPVKITPVNESESSETDSDDSSDEDVPAKSPATATKKADSSDSSESESESEDENSKKAVQATKIAPAAAKRKDDSSDSSDSDESDEEPRQKKQKDAGKVAPKSVKKDSSSDDDSSNESSDDEPKKEVMTATKSQKEEPKTPASNKGQATGTKTLWMGNLSFNIEYDQVKQFFAQIGEVVDVRLATHEDGHPKGFGHVEFASEEDAQKALDALNGGDLIGRPVRLDLAAERGASALRTRDGGSFGKPSGGPSLSVFVKGFDSSQQEDAIRSSLQEHFSKCGEITRVSVPMDHENGASKGIAYMDFTDESSFSKALELSGSDLGGCNLYVAEAKPKGQFGGGGGRSGGRDGGRSGGGRFGRSGGRDGGRGGGRGYQSRQSAGTASAGKKTTFGDD